MECKEGGVRVEEKDVNVLVNREETGWNHPDVYSKFYHLEKRED